MSSSTYLYFLAVAWLVTSLRRELDGDFKKFTTKSYWIQKSYCSKCLSFWLTLGLTGNFILAAGVAATINLYNKITKDGLSI